MEQNINKNIFVTGANGFLGKKITLDLANKGYKITALVRNVSWTHKNIKFIKGDLLDIEKIKIPKLKFDVVIHMAAFVGMHEKSGRLFRDNYLVSEKLIKFFEKSNTYLIYFSTIEAHGPTRKKIVDEDDFDNPLTDYGKIKLKTENLIKKSRIKYSILRIGNVESENKGIIFSLKQLISQNNFYSKIQYFILKEILSDYELNAIQIKDISEIVFKIIAKKPNNILYFATNERVSMKKIFGRSSDKYSFLVPFIVFIFKIISYFKISHVIGYITMGGLKRRYRNYNNNRIVGDLKIKFNKII